MEADNAEADLVEDLDEEAEGVALVEYADDEEEEDEDQPLEETNAITGELEEDEEEIRALLLGGLEQDTKILTELGIEAVSADDGGEPEEGQLPTPLASFRPDGAVLSGLKVLGACTICSKNKAKYRCPRCFEQSCSLECSKKHKEDASCSGQRNLTEFTPLSQFTDSTLRSDYNFLQGIATDAKTKPRVKATQLLPAHLKNFLYQAKKRDIRLKLMPLGMSKRKKNRSQYDYKRHIIVWRVEWRLAARPELVLATDKMDETQTLLQGLELSLKAHITATPADSEIFKPYLDGIASNLLKFLFRIEPFTAAQASYLEVNGSDSLLTTLQRKQVLEYPTFVVALPSEKDSFKIVPTPALNEESSVFPPTPHLMRGGSGRGRGRGGRGRGRGGGRGRGRLPHQQSQPQQV